MLAEFSIFPMDQPHMSRDVAKIVEILEQCPVNYRLGPMSTSVEGDWDQIIDAIRKCHQAMTESGHERVITNIVIDDHQGAEHSLIDAVTRVEEQLGRPVHQ